MSLLGLLVVLAIVGVGLYLFNTLVAASSPVKNAINAIALLFVFLYVIQCFGWINLGLHLK